MPAISKENIKCIAGDVAVRRPTISAHFQL